MKGNKTELSFICIGFQKCGTTSLYDLLKQHSDIYLTEDVKEPMFYRVPFVRQILGRDWYRHRYFGHLEEAGRMGTDRLELTHEQIGGHLGSAREVVSRMLKHFQKEGLVQLGRGSITLSDEEGLTRLAQGSLM